MQQCMHGAANIDGGEDANDVAVLQHYTRTVFVGGHLVAYFIKGRVRRNRIDRRAHRIFDFGGFDVDVTQGLDDGKIAVGQHAYQLAALQHRQVADFVVAHHLVGDRQRLVRAHRVRAGAHVFCDGWNCFHSIDKSINRATYRVGTACGLPGQMRKPCIRAAISCIVCAQMLNCDF